jgi:hypothetical protein
MKCIKEGKWSLELSTGTKYDEQMNVVDRNWWFATIDYDDCMICYGGNGNTAVDAIIDAMKPLTTKACTVFVSWVHKQKQLPVFYWIYNNTFALNGKLYEVSSRNYKAVLYCLTDRQYVDLKDLPFDPVPFDRKRPPIIQVREALQKEQRDIDSMDF